MCILGIALNKSEEFPFILISIRDEFTSREESLDPKLEQGIISSLDRKSNGSWLLLNTNTNRMGVVLNIGGRGKTKGRKKPRGKLLYDFVSSEKEEIEKLRWEERREYPGFNLFWFDFKKNEGNLVSNCDPLDEKMDLPTIHKLSGEDVFVVGNDLYGDEHVKSPYMKKEMENLIKNHNNETKNNEEEEVNAEILSRKLADNLTGFPSLSLWLILSKFFHFSKKRRVQPGLNTFFSLLFLNFFLFLLLSIIFSTFSFALFFTLLIISFVIGFTHHLLMQKLFVHVPIKAFGLEWKTVSQTVILRSKEGKYYYFFRRTRSDHQMSKWFKFVA